MPSEKQILEWKLQLEKLKLQRDKYYADNKIEVFGIKDEKMGFKGANPLQEKILEAWLDRRYKIFTYCGANRIGKTTAGVIITLSTLFGEFLWNKKKLPFNHPFPRKIRYVGQDWEKHIKTVVEPELRKWWPKNRQCEVKKNNFGIDAFWTDVKSGSTLEIMSNNQESEVHEGWSGDLLVYDEPPKRDIRVANARGLIDRLGRELFCMTLLKEGWVDREVIRALNEDGSPDDTVFNVHGDIYSNVGYGITIEGIKQFEKSLTEEEKEARIKGIPSYLSGLVYPQFKREVHLKERFDIPSHWIVDIGIDVHPREKQAVLFVATNTNNEKFVCDEIFEHGPPEYIANMIVRRIEDNNYRVGSIIIDPFSKGDKNNEYTIFDRVFNVLSSHGHGLRVASKDRSAGILEVKDALMTKNNEPALFFFKDLRRTVMEIEGYMYDKETQSPVDKNDHMVENLYRIMLLNTQYYDAVEYDSSIDDREIGRNVITGY